MRKMYHTVADATNSYTKVPVAELQSLGVADKITSSSFMKDGMAYLAEKPDLATFMEARDSKGLKTSFKVIQRKNCNRIRGYSCYTS